MQKLKSLGLLNFTNSTKIIQEYMKYERTKEEFIYNSE
jgi:hypothetical protein